MINNSISHGSGGSGDDADTVAVVATTSTTASNSYPLPAYLKFCPGGIAYARQQDATAYYYLQQASTSPVNSPANKSGVAATASTSASSGSSNNNTIPGESSTNSSSSSSSSSSSTYPNVRSMLIHQACVADDRLRRYALLSATRHNNNTNNADAAAAVATAATVVPFALPSLSVLAEAAFGRLTGVPANQAKEWADAMVLAHFPPNTWTTKQQDSSSSSSSQQSQASTAASVLDCNNFTEHVPESEEEIWNAKPKAVSTPLLQPDEKLAVLLKRHLRQRENEYEMAHAQAMCMPANGASVIPRLRRGPCGYVFARGDIAWNCRTCQADATCVICDACFRHSDHTGHEVYFHRTTPGGCCDCGDVEAWNVNGCCDKHRPDNKETGSAGDDTDNSGAMMNNNNSDSTSKSKAQQQDPMEAVYLAAKGQAMQVETITTGPTALPQVVTAALAVVIGAAVQCLVNAVDGAAIGADATQFRVRWPDEACRILQNTPHKEDTYYSTYTAVGSGNTNTNTNTNPVASLSSPPLSPRAAGLTAPAQDVSPELQQQYPAKPSPPQQGAHPKDFWDKNRPQVLPNGYRLHLRLHNDDVHTFDEVIDALHEPPRTTLNRRTINDNSNAPNNSASETASLVTLREQATKMTHHVDADGQVTVKTYDNCASALAGFRRLKMRGLHCAVVSTAQVHAEQRARQLTSWLTEISSAHPAAAALVVHALVQVHHNDHALANYHVWREARLIPPWTAMDVTADNYNNNNNKNNNNGNTNNSWDSEIQACRRRFAAFPPHLPSSYVTREEAELIHGIALTVSPSAFVDLTGADPSFYSKVTYRLPSERYHKSPHALWGTLPSLYADPIPPTSKHPFLQQLLLSLSGQAPLLHHQPLDASILSMKNGLTESVVVVDTDLRKQQEADRVTASVYPHKLPGLNIISGVGMSSLNDLDARRPPLASPMDLRHLLATSSFRAPLAPILLLLLLDPYPTKQLRGTVHALFLSLLTDIRFKCRFAGALGIAYRPLSTLFCAGVGTEADTPLHFSVQLLTTGSLVRALGSAPATEKLLLSDKEENKDPTEAASIGVFASPIGHTIVRCIHTNLLGATKEVNMILNNTYSGNVDDDSPELGRQQQQGNDGLLPALTYVAGEHPLMTLLPAAPDDGFLDSRSTRHKRLPHLLRDLEYVIETPGTAMRLLLSHRFPVYQGLSLSFRGEDVLAFSSVFARMLRLAQGMDPQKRKISGGHVEYEQNRWLEAFGLSLNLSGTRDALAESPATSNAILAISSSNGTGDDAGSHLLAFREAMGNLVASLLRELKLWLYREGMLETGLPIPSGGPHGAMDLAQVEALQRSTLHVTGVTSVITDGSNPTGTNMVALSCATGVKMTETQLSLIESALKAEGVERLHRSSELGHVSTQVSAGGTVMGDWLRVPHSPLAGDSLSFHLPLHRGLAKSVRSICSAVVPQDIRNANPNNWWKIPVLDEEKPAVSSDVSILPTHPLVPLIRSTLRSSNCRVVWTSGPDCSPQEAQRRRSRSRNVAANIAVAKVIHSLADHPIRCLAAAQQIERHLWARNGSSVAGMAVNYTSTPLCRSFRDLDLLLVQLSASGMSVGLGSRRIFSLLLSRFTMDGYLCDPEKRLHMSSSGSSSPGPYASGMNSWVNPPRLQDPDHAIVLSESFFSTMCVLVTELPPPPPASASDTIALRQSIRRELVHALASEPRSRSEAMTAAAIGVTRREDSEGSSGNSGGGGLFRTTFAEVLEEIGKQKNQGTARAASGPPAFELKPEFCDEYDPTFYHLRRQEHQHAMDVVARLRKQKWDNKDAVETHCLPLVCMPPKAHPRFLPCRLLLHLPPLDAAIRRSLLFALTGGSWLPPPEPMPLPSSASLDDSHGGDGVDSTDMAGMTMSRSAGASFSQIGDVPLTTFSRRSLNSRQLNSASSFLKRQGSDGDGFAPFSKEIVAASAISFLEVLQLLTLQVHTLEECASLHRILPDLDEESRLLSSGLSINSYLSRLVWIPDSLVGEWALRPFPGGPLESKGSGQMRGSILGLLIALYEHRSDHSSELDTEDGPGDDGHGGARTLATSGLKWLLRFVSALVDGASSVGSATKSATSGVPVQGQSSSSPAKPDSGSPPWTIDEGIRSTIRAMLSDLPDLWPRARAKTPTVDSSNTKSKKDGKAAQQKIMAMMLSKQKAFAASIGPADDKVDTKMQEECIICRCDDADGENNGPLGYLGHVQRSRCIQIRSTAEATNVADTSPTLPNTYRVVGHMGCQLRETEAMDSKALTCLPKGSVVTVLKTTISPEYNILSRRVLVRHVGKNPRSPTEVLSEGWASVQSSQGYVILSPLVSLCYSNSRWGSTRPVIKQCGHAAHLKCVETHTLSLHQRAAGEQPYDGRFAANIADGEFLCPLCKQLSNILIPRDSFGSSQDDTMDTAPSDDSKEPESEPDKRPLRNLFISSRLTQRQLDFTEDLRWQALERFGDNIHQAMTVPWERISSSRKKNQQQWHPAIRKWDFEDDVGDSAEKNVKGVPRLLRQQLIAWAAIGHSAAAAEASSRGVEEVLPFGLLSQTSDPWQDFKMSSKDTHPMLLELKRTLAGASGLYEVLCLKMTNQLARRDGSSSDAPIIGSCLSDIIDGWSWFLGMSSPQKLTSELALWSEITALTAALPCHVSRDGVIPQRCEARATAGAMWAVKGVGTAEVAPGDPPVPLVIRRVIGGPANGPGIPRGWGTIDCFTASSESENRLRTPFRLGVGCAYLYVPMLAWDLCTLAGALFSSVLVNDLKDLPTSEELLHIARVLTTARIVQAMITPGGIQLPDEMELGDEDCWSAEEVQTQGTALARLLAHCRTIVSTKSLNAGTGLVGSIDGLVPSTVLAGVGRAVLPFARSLVLIVRGSSAIIRERSQRSGVSARKSVAADTLLDQFICNSDIMEAEDGFHVLRALEAPPPLALIDNSSPWLSLINRWLVAVVGLELHHGSVGRSLLPSILPHATQKEAAPDALAPAKMPSKSSDAAKRPSDEQDRAVDRDEDMADANDAGAAQFHQHPALVELMEDVDNIDVEEIGLDEVDDMDEDEEEMVGFAEQMLGAPGLSLNSLQDETGESGDENSESGSEDENRGVDREFAHVSRSPILLYQPSLLGVEEIGPGMNGVSFEYAAASAVMSDLSHLGSIHRKSEPTFSLVRLPKSFVELYNIVNIIKGREDITAGDDTEDVGSTETAICLLTGAVMRSGSSRRSAYNRTLRPPGACTLHARTNGSGIGIFFLVQKCTVLLMHNNKSAYSPSIYVDEHGEEDPGLRRGRPLFLNDARYRALELLWRQQSIPREVAQIRSTSDRVIRDNWY